VLQAVYQEIFINFGEPAIQKASISNMATQQWVIKLQPVLVQKWHVPIAKSM